MLVLSLCAALLIWREVKLNRDYAAAQLELSENKGKYAEDVIILDGTRRLRAEALAERLGATLRISRDGSFATLRLPEGVSVEEVYSDRDNRALLAEMNLDYKVSPCDTEEEEALLGPNYRVNDERYYLQGYLNYINLGNVWNETRGSLADGGRVTVAVIDTGIDTDHPEFFDSEGKSIISLKSYNSTEDKVVEVYGSDLSLIEDTNGHGTTVAGVIAAQMNEIGTVGVSPEIELLVIKCETDETGEFRYSSDLVFGIYYAIEQGADVINMSFSGIENVYSSALKLAVESDIICVASAGNDGTDIPLYYPAADVNAIGVGALAENSWELASYSNFGGNSDIVAPGTAYTTETGGGYTYTSGTSISAPIVSSAAALYVAYNKYVDYETVRAELLAAGRDLGDKGKDSLYGFGALDVNAFILEEKGTITYDMGTEELENTSQVFIREHTIQTVPTPEREKLVFDDWYYDKAYTRVFDYSTYFTTTMIEDITLYAKWVNEDDEGASVYVYQVLDDGTAEILSYKGKRRYLTVPETLDGYTVSSIGENAFFGNSRLREVVFPESLVYIKGQAFAVCTSLRSVTFTGNELLSIGVKSFSSCRSLLSLTLPDSVLEIGGEAFNGCSSLSSLTVGSASRLRTLGNKSFSSTALTEFYIPKNCSFDGSVLAGSIQVREVRLHPENPYYTVEDYTVFTEDMQTIVYYPPVYNVNYTVPDSVRTVGTFAFAYSKISGIELSQVAVIESSAFQNTRKLSSVIIPDSVFNMGVYCFLGSSISSVTLSESLTSIPYAGFSMTNLTSVRIPRRVATIEQEAFYGNDRMRTLVFAEGSELLLIGDDAFSACTALESFALPAGLQEIGDRAFSECSSVTSLNLPRDLTTLGMGAFLKCVKLGRVRFDSSSPLEYVSERCFEGCVSLTDVSFSDGITKIRDSAFSGCLMLSTLAFRSGSRLDEVGNYAFYSCSALRSLQLPSGVVRIGDFAYCFSGLTSLAVPAALTEIGKGSFGACYLLTSITVEAGNTAFSASDNVLFSTDGTTLHCVPSSRSGSYTVPDTVRTVSYYAFYYDIHLDEIILPDGLTDIREHAFYQCSSLRSIIIPAPVFNIGRYAFAYCYSLESVEFAENAVIERLGIYTFVSCHSLKEMTVPASVSAMAQYVFYDCYGLESIAFAENSSLSYISAFMFEGCFSLKEIVFGRGSALTELQANSFNGLTSLVRLELGDAEIETVDNYAFMFCSGLSELSLPDTVSYIGRYAFYGCSQLDRLDIPEAVEYIGENAFFGTKNIKVFFKSESLPEYIQEGWDGGIAGYFLGAIEYVSAPLWDYVITLDGKVAIVSYKGNASSLTIDKIDGRSVVKLGARAFYGNNILTSLILPEGLVEIGNQSLYGCTALRSLTLPGSVEEIGEYAFARSNISVTVPQGSALERIGSYAFTDNPTLSLALPSCLGIIEERAFYNSKIESITFGEESSLTSIGKEAFVGSQLKAVTLPSAVKTVGVSAFSGLTCLTSLNIDAGDTPLAIENGAFMGTGIIELTLPARVHYIGEYTFGSCPELQNINVSGDSPYYSSLDGVLCSAEGDTILQYPSGRVGSYCVPKSVTVLGYASFKDTKRLTELSFESGSIVRTIGWQTLSGCTSLRSITVPDSLVSFDFYACQGCVALEEVVIGEGSELSGIYEGAFFGCSSLESISLPGSVMEIGEYAFFGCTSLAEFPLPENASVRGIYDYAFAGCLGITEVPALPHLVEIGDFAFAQTGITEYTVPATVRTIGASSFIDSELLNLYVEEGNLFFKSIDGVLVEYGDTDIETAEFVIFPAARVYLLGEGKSRLTADDVSVIKSMRVGKVKIADSVTSIDEYAFFNCDSLTVVILPEAMTRIDAYAFAYAVALETVELPDSLSAIGMRAFYACFALREINLNEGLVSIGNGAFYDCRSLESLSLPTTVTEIEPYAFSNATGLKTITLHDGLKSIGRYAFAYSGNLESITLCEGLQSIDEYAFYRCESLNRIVIPESVTVIGDSAFDGTGAIIGVRADIAPGGFSFYWSGNCGVLYSFHSFADTAEGVYGISRNATSAFMRADKSALTVTVADSILGTSVTEISASAFLDCTELVSVSLPDTLTHIGDTAFGGCGALPEIIIPHSVTEIDNSAFTGCTSLWIGFEADTLPTLGWNWDGEDSGIVDTEIQGYCLSTVEFVYTDGTVAGVSPDGTVALAGLANTDGAVTLPQQIDGRDVVRIGSTAFRSTKVSEVTLHSKIHTVDEGAFSNATLLTGVSGGEGLRTVGASAFYGCTALESVSLPAGLTVIEDWAFYGCTALAELTLPEELVRLGAGAFSGCSGVERIFYNSKNIESLGGWIFAGVGIETEGTSLTVGNKVTRLPDDLFRGIAISFTPNNIKWVTFEEGSICREIGSRAFGDCENLEYIILPGSVRNVVEYAFEGCKAVIGFSADTLPAQLGYSWHGDCSYYTGVTGFAYKDGRLVVKLRDGSETVAVSGSVMRIMELVELLESPQGYNDRFLKIRAALDLYGRLSPEDKADAEETYSRLAAIVDAYNAELEEINESHSKSYALAANVILTSSTLLLGAWLMLRKINGKGGNV